jgi:hypothetical protein
MLANFTVLIIMLIWFAYAPNTWFIGSVFIAWVALNTVVKINTPECNRVVGRISSYQDDGTVNVSV